MRIAMPYVARIALFALISVSPVGAQQFSGPPGADRTGAMAEEPQIAQDATQARSSQATPGQSIPVQTVPVQTTHRFWDRTNDMWFAGVGAARFLDFASTLNLRHRGLDEIFLTNSIVDNHALFAGIEVAGTAASIGASYLFHRTGHHQLERWTSIIHFGLAVGGAGRNYALKTPHNH
jgi:hypothetical protein